MTSRALLSKITLVVAACLIGFALLELGARIMLPSIANDSEYMDKAFLLLSNSPVVFDPQAKNYDARFGFRVSPNSERTLVTTEFQYRVTTNSFGFRAKEIKRKNNDTYRIMLLGDSMFWGVGVEEKDTISNVIESMSPAKLDVYNLSVGGYNTVQEMIVAKDYLKSINPDHIIIGFAAYPFDSGTPNGLR